ncbi:MAG: VWA domain-containing protein [Solobacterium sp.]|nr:VWA domain-containing protein [Solobacterium sp.]
MKNNKTEIVFILDRSGSMSGLEKDTIGGYNSFLRKQKNEEGDAVVSTVLFDHKTEVLHDRADIKDVRDITEKEYYVRGTTALLDAVGSAITHIREVQFKEEIKPDRTVFVIITDGYENSSREYTYPLLKRMIERQKAEGWEFLFLGANIDAAEEARKFGIDEDRSVRFHNDPCGVAVNFETVSAAISEIRHEKKLSKGWKKSIEADYKSRNSK